MTTVLHDSKSGEIVDTDIELNGVDYTWTTSTTTGVILTDVQNAMTHEIGHVLGLEHSAEELSVMYPSSKDGELKKRQITQDDIDGLCALYPVDGEDLWCQPETTSGGCGGCATGDGPGSPFPLLLLLMAAFAVFVVRMIRTKRTCTRRSS